MPNWFRRTEAANDDIRVSSALLGSPPQEFICDSCMFEGCAPPIPVASLIGCSGVGDAVVWESSLRFLYQRISPF